MMTVSEVSRLSGVSVRTLHHYDAIGLLKPSVLTKAGYRMYDDAAIARLQEILLLRELMFPLGEIKQILDSPGHDRKTALKDQIRLLEMQRDHISDMIALAMRLQNGGIDTMNFDAFDNSKFEDYKAEAKQRWGDTSAYSEYKKKHENKGPAAMNAAGEGLMDLIAETAALRPLPHDDAAVTAKVREIQAFITANFYECTDEIFASLAQMYTGDPRMRANIDKAGGEGAAEYVSSAILHALAR